MLVGMHRSTCPVVVMQGRVKWAIAGRNQAKLESIRSHIASINPECKVCGTALTAGQNQVCTNKHSQQQKRLLDK